MDHIKVLKRAFQITWNYKALWIFGIILALTVASRGNPGNPGSPGSQAQDTANKEGIQSYEGIPETIELPDGSEVAVPEVLQEVNTWIAIGVITSGCCLGCCCCLGLVWIVAWAVLRYVAETALIRMVDDYEKTGEKRGIREGFRLGWSRPSLRLFLIDLLIALAGLVVFLPPFVLVAVLVIVSIVMFTSGVIVLGVIIVVAAAGLFFLTLFFAIVVGIVIDLFKPFFQRACVLEGMGVGESLARSLDMMKRHFAWDIAIMWLLTFGLEIGWIVATFIVGLLLFVVALMVAAVPALVVGGLVSLLFHWIAGLIVGGVIGGLIFALLMIAATTLLQGLRMTFLSTVWTLTYRELLALEGLNEKELLEQPDSHELQ
jgi:hypothetical protein